MKDATQRHETVAAVIAIAGVSGLLALMCSCFEGMAGKFVHYGGVL